MAMKLLLTIGLPLVSIIFALIALLGLVYFIRKRRKYAEVVEDWELEYKPHRYKYKDLYIATKGFKETEILGRGRFGMVYKGVFPSSKLEITVKLVYLESRPETKVFIAEFISFCRLRHKNIVSLLGYCRRKDELLLVYDYMPNRSLDKYLYGQPNTTINWSQRFRVIKGVASGLLYLHEEWEQVVVHRDVKASNVFLDNEMNVRLGDFGVARLYDPRRTQIVNVAYEAPEYVTCGRATTKIDVFSFGVFMLEVASGRRALKKRALEDVLLVDWVYSLWATGEILEAKDPNLGSDYIGEEVELVLKLGLMCNHLREVGRPSMRQVVQYLHGDIAMPELSTIDLSVGETYWE